MRIGLLETKVERRKGNLGLIAKALSENDLDVVVAPEFFLSGFDLSGLSIQMFKSAAGIIKDVEDLSKEYSALIIPGTMLYTDLKGRVVNACPVAYRGESRIYFKESDSGEQMIAENKGREYYRGNSFRNKFVVNGKVFALEICRDQGRQKIPENTDIEIVPSYDLKSGYHLSKDKSINSRDIFLCDGQRPMVSGARYDKDTRNVSLHQPVKLNGISIFEVK